VANEQERQNLHTISTPCPHGHLGAVRAITDFDVIGLALHEAEISVTYSGRPEQLRDALAQQNLQLSGDATKPAPPLPVIERKTEHGTERVIVVDPEYVRQQVASIVKNQDLSRYIL